MNRYIARLFRPRWWRARSFETTSSSTAGETLSQFVVCCVGLPKAVLHYSSILQEGLTDNHVPKSYIRSDAWDSTADTTADNNHEAKRIDVNLDIIRAATM